VAWCLADPKLGEHEVAADLLADARDHGALRDQMIVQVDKGMAGRKMEHYAADVLHVLLGSPSACSPWLPASGTTGVLAPAISDP